MDLSKVVAPRGGGQLADMRSETAPDIRWDALDALAPCVANHAAIAVSRDVLVRTIALLS